MIKASQEILDIINSPVRQIEAKVELYDGSTLVDVFEHNGKLISFDIERAGDDSKFFGFGVCQKINVKLIDKDRELDGDRAITTANHFKIAYRFKNEDFAIMVHPHPDFFITEVHRDENTNELSITAYDALKDIDKLNASNLINLPSKNILGFIAACAEALGLVVRDDEDNIVSIKIALDTNGAYKNFLYDSLEDINIQGDETLRAILNALAEVSHSIYYIDNFNYLHFKSLTDEENVISIDKSQYITLDSKTNRKLTTVVHTTELSDNLSSSTGAIGSTQYLRSNPFIELLPDYAITVLDDIISYLGNFTINQFNMSWRGNPLVEIGDKLVLTTKDDKTVESYLFNDSISYDGALSQKTSWSYQDNEEETESAPTTLGEAIKQTYARIDKVNQEISLVVKNTDEALTNVNDDLDALSKEVALKLDSDGVKIQIEEAVGGLGGITTSTGYTFDENGLKISKSETDITTTITENGMVVKQGDSDEKLVANAEGVKAEDLHATTYLIIGKNSRFEDYTNANGVAKTACFWIGGNA